jgi:hypothetical protein
VTAVIRAERLSKRYRKLWALADCTLSITAGHVVGLVGPNGAGKTTLLNPGHRDAGAHHGHDRGPQRAAASGPAQLARIGYLAQDAPVYAGLSVADHLSLGAHLNPGWDADMARRRIDQLGLDPGQKAGKLSGGQRKRTPSTRATPRSRSSPPLSPASPAPGSPPAEPSTPPGSRSAPPPRPASQPYRGSRAGVDGSDHGPRLRPKAPAAESRHRRAAGAGHHRARDADHSRAFGGSRAHAADVTLTTTWARP